MRAELSADLSRILDTFTGADGGVSFVKLRGMLSALDHQAANGDKAAAEVLAVVRRFARLIEAAERVG